MTAHVDSAQLDLPVAPVRLRLNATVVKVLHQGVPATATGVTVSYADPAGKPVSVSAAHVVLACWHRVIPYLTDEISDAPIDALNDQQKVPLIYTNVQLRNWEAFDALKIEGFSPVGYFWTEASINFPVSMGDFKFADLPADPVIVHLSKALVGPEGAPAREQALAGKRALFELTFEDMERAARDLPARALGPGGFDPARDIEAITCNRWSHGYSYEYMRP